jgi:hypothetical protein
MTLTWCHLSCSYVKSVEIVPGSAAHHEVKEGVLAVFVGAAVSRPGPLGGRGGWEHAAG